MKTNKLMAVLTAAAMISALAPMSTFADTGTDLKAPGETGTLTVSYNVEAARVVEPAYTVTIPASVTLGGTADIVASDVSLAQGQKIYVTLTSATNTDSGNTFNAMNVNNTSTVTYSIKRGEQRFGINDTVATFTENGVKSLTFTKIDDPSGSGEYTETLTFTLSVSDSQNNDEQNELHGGDVDNHNMHGSDEP